MIEKERENSYGELKRERLNIQLFSTRVAKNVADTPSHPLEKRNGQKRVPLVLCTSKTEVHIKSFFFLKEIAAIDKIPYRERKTKDQRTLSPKISPPVQRKK